MGGVEKLNLKKIEEGLTNALTNDSYFRDEINKIVNNNAYVTSHELYQFVLQIIKEYLTTCDLVPSADSDVYILRIPKSDPKVVKRFLEQFQPIDPDSKKLFRRYITDIEDELELRMTFHQERAFKEKSLAFINIYHPIIRAGVKFFEAKRDKSQCTFFFQLKSDHLPSEIGKGLYMLAIYKISVSRTQFEKDVVTDSLYPILFDVSNDRLVDDQSLAERFMGRAQVDGQYAPLDESNRLSEDLIADLRYDFTENVNAYVWKHRGEMQTRIDNNKKLRYQQTIQYYDTRQKSLEKNIANQEMMREYALSSGNDESLRRAENTLRLHRANLRDLMDRKESDIERINRDVHLKVTQEIKSLNLVQVV